MGCCESKPLGPPLVVDPSYATVGLNPNRIPLESRIDLKSKIVLSCGGIFVTASPSAQVDALFLYPDLAFLRKGVCEHVKKNPPPEGCEDDPDFAKPDWLGIRVEMKEFDTPDDVIKDWYEEGNCIPGVYSIETAGPLGAWAVMAPHMFQQRFVLPNDKRMCGPVQGEKDFEAHECHMTFDREFWRESATADYPSIPQRVYIAYKARGEDMLDNLVKRLIISLNTMREKAEECAGEFEVAIPQSLLDIVDDIPNVLEEKIAALKAKIETMKDCNSSHSLDDDFGFIKMIFVELEDNILYNWFQVKMDAQIQVGLYKSRKSDPSEMKYSKTMWDRVLLYGIETADEKGEDYQKTIAEKLEKKTKAALDKWLKGDDDDEDFVDELFPDLDDIIDRITGSVRLQSSGLTEDVPHNEEVLAINEECADMKQVLKKWQDEDELPLEQRREKLYLATMEELRAHIEDYDRDQFADWCRFPHILPKHFQPFTFFLTFEKKAKTEEGEWTKEMYRCPNVAQLKIWVEGGDADEDAEMHEMAPFDLPPEQEMSKYASKAAATLDDGDSSIGEDSDVEDPRLNWPEYPSDDFRGFEVTVNVAIGATYYFNFDLDGVLFVDHDSFYTDNRHQCRKVRFTAKAQPFTVNPLSVVGMTLA